MLISIGILEYTFGDFERISDEIEIEMFVDNQLQQIRLDLQTTKIKKKRLCLYCMLIFCI